MGWRQHELAETGNRRQVRAYSWTYQKLGHQGLPLAHVLRTVLGQPLPALPVVGQGALDA